MAQAVGLSHPVILSKKSASIRVIRDTVSGRRSVPTHHFNALALVQTGQGQSR
jgi:hypothetical protein